MNKNDDSATFNMILSSVTEILLVASNPGNNTKASVEEAQQKMDIAENNYWSMWITALVMELRNEEKPPETRQIAGIRFRRCLVPRNNNFDLMKAKWLSVPDEFRNTIKKNLLETMLFSRVFLFRKVAAEAAAQVAFLDLSNWRDFLDGICHWISKPNNGDQELREAALVALSELIQELALKIGFDNSKILSKNFNQIFMAVKAAADTNIEKNILLSLKTIQYLVYVDESLATKTTNIDKCVAEVIKWTHSPKENVVSAAFSCLIEFAVPLYNRIQPHIEEIFVISSKIMRENLDEENTKYAIEFWTSVVEYEIENPSLISLGVSKKLVPHLEIFLNCLKLPQDLDDTWSINAAASAFISSITICLGDEVLLPVIAWFKQTMCSTSDIDVCVAAIYAFGSVIVAGQKSAEYYQYMNSILADLLKLVLMENQNYMITYQVLWVLTVVAELQPKLIFENNIEKTVLEISCYYLKAENVRLAIMACRVLYNLFENFEKSPCNPINPCMQTLMDVLAEVLNMRIQKSDNLLILIFETIISLINIIPDDQLQLIEGIVTYIMPVLLESSKINTPDVHDVQGELCGVMSACIRSLGKNTLPVAPNMMETFFILFKCSTSSSVFQEVFMAICAMVAVLGPNFAPYVKDVMYYTTIALGNEDEELFKQALYLISDLALLVPELFNDYKVEVLRFLLDNKVVKDRMLNDQLFPNIITTISDVVSIFPPSQSMSDFLRQISEILSYGTTRVVTQQKMFDKMDLTNNWNYALISLFYTLQEKNMDNNTTVRISSIALSYATKIIRSNSSTEFYDTVLCRLITNLLTNKHSPKVISDDKNKILNYLQGCVANQKLPEKVYTVVSKTLLE